jgi:nucleotide-binding universal stress UspA family protein
VPTILDLVQDENVDLLVMGTHGGGSPLRRHVLGSTTEGVLAHADLPVLIVPGAVSDLHSFDDRREVLNIGSVLAPIDFSALSRRDARVAAGIAETLDVPLLLVYVCPSPVGPSLDADAAAARLLALRSELLGATPIETLVLHGHPADEIAALAARRTVGLIVMGLRGAGGATGPRPGGIASRALRLTPTMLLALPPSLRRLTPRHVVRTDQAVAPC